MEETAALHDEWLRKQGGPHPLPHIPTPFAADVSYPMTERMMSTIVHDLKAHEAAWIERTGKEEPQTMRIIAMLVLRAVCVAKSLPLDLVAKISTMRSASNSNHCFKEYMS